MTPRRLALLAMPWALLASTYLAFVGLEELLGPTRGYFAAFVVYWVGWCLLFPLWFLGKKGLKHVLSPVRFSRSRATAGGLVLLAVPPVLALATVFVTKIPQATVAVVLGSLGLAVVNGTAEEVLWRGVYIREFPGDLLRGFLYPTLGFALWHLAPQAVHPLSMPGGVAAFVAGAFFMGACWGWVAWKTGSVRWAICSHVLTDFLGLGATVYFL